MNVLGGFIILATLGLVGVPTAARAQWPDEKQSSHAVAPASNAEAAALQQKASEAQARIRANQEDTDQLKRAVKINEVDLAREVLLRNGFTAKDLENAKISLRTGGGKGGGDTIEISASCCDPKAVTIQRTLESSTKSRR